MAFLDYGRTGTYNMEKDPKQYQNSFNDSNQCPDSVAQETAKEQARGDLEQRFVEYPN